MHDTIILIGFMGAGKSTIAECLGQSLGWEVVELDDLIARREGMEIPEIFRLRGEEYFRERESALLAEQLARPGIILSCGGGTPMRPSNVAEMKKKGRVVFLSASPQTVYERVRHSHDRPLLEGNKNVAYIGELMAQRRETYEAAADIRIETDNKGKQEICEELLRRLREFEEKGEGKP